MGDHYPYGAEYGCSITKHKRRMPLSEKVLYALAPFCVIAAIAFNNFH